MIIRLRFALRLAILIFFPGFAQLAMADQNREEKVVVGPPAFDLERQCNWLFNELYSHQDEKKTIVVPLFYLEQINEQFRNNTLTTKTYFDGSWEARIEREERSCRREGTIFFPKKTRCDPIPFNRGEIEYFWCLFVDEEGLMMEAGISSKVGGRTGFSVPIEISEQAKVASPHGIGQR